jgi:uncharacterized alkaline shock family protein YloU
VPQPSTPQGSQSTSSPASPGPGSEVSRRKPDGEVSALRSERGTTTIADDVVEKVAGIAAREIRGVHALGGGVSRALGAAGQRVGIGRQGQGVSVEVGSREAAVDLSMVVEYGEAIPRIVEQVRENVIRRIEGLVGLTVTEVNVEVNDLHLPGEDDDDVAPARVA